MTNQIKHLNFSGHHLKAICVEDVKDCYIQNRTIVINPLVCDVHLNGPQRNIIPPLSSTILKNTRIEKAPALFLIEMTEIENLGNIILEPGWNLLGDTIGDSPSNVETLPFPKNTPLWRSPQDKAIRLELDPYVMTRQAIAANHLQSFDVHLNLWFAPAHTHCFIHNQHDFIEIHTQVWGQGRMQKFNAQDYNTLYEDMLMSPGFTTSVPFCQVEGQHQYTYPWHQYYCDTDCIWLAIEYHPCQRTTIRINL